MKKENRTKESCNYKVISIIPDDLDFEKLKEIMCRKIARIVINKENCL